MTTFLFANVIASGIKIIVCEHSRPRWGNVLPLELQLCARDL